MLKRTLLGLSVLSLLIVSCSEENVEDQIQTETANNNFNGSFVVDGKTINMEDAGNGAMMPGAVYMIKSNAYDTIVNGTDTVVNRYMTIWSRYTMSYTSRTSKEKLIITTDSLKYITGPFRSALMLGADTLKTYQEKSNYAINRMPAIAFYDIFSRPSYKLASNGGNGFKVKYVDANGTAWASDSIAQTGSSISISVSGKSVFSDGLEYVKANVKFNCAISNGTSSKTITTTNGSMKGLFINSR